MQVISRPHMYVLELRCSVDCLEDFEFLWVRPSNLQISVAQYTSHMPSA